METRTPEELLAHIAGKTARDYSESTALSVRLMGRAVATRVMIASLYSRIAVSPACARARFSRKISGNATSATSIISLKSSA